LPGISLNNDFYLIGYSQGGWATLALHKALELDHSNEFNLRGSVCGAGPYDIGLLLSQMTANSTYPVPAYLAYIVNAYTSYSQFTNPVTEIFNQPYASKVSTLFNGSLSIDQVSNQLTTSIPGLLTSDFLSSYKTAAKYSSVRDALVRNSISAWKTEKPLFLVHGGSDTQVNPISTENMYAAMIAAGTSPILCRKLIVPGKDHGDGLIPSMLEGILFLNGIKGTK
jgi:pimeloyl-ACP methyl ester carboxylesterase